MYFLRINILIVSIAVLVVRGQQNPAPSAPTTNVGPTPSPHPVYNPNDGGNPQDVAASGYVPHVTYPYADVYGPLQPYEGYWYPGYPSMQGNTYMASIIPAARNALQVALRLFAKVGLFLVGGVALLVVGGIFTAAVCSLTPFCTITFAGFGGIDKDAVRSLMTPEKISTAAAMVQDAIGKYQSLERTVRTLNSQHL